MDTSSDVLLISFHFSVAPSWHCPGWRGTRDGDGPVLRGKVIVSTIIIKHSAFIVYVCRVAPLIASALSFADGIPLHLVFIRWQHLLKLSIHPPSPCAACAVQWWGECWSRGWHDGEDSRWCSNEEVAVQQSKMEDWEIQPSEIQVIMYMRQWKLIMDGASFQGWICQHHSHYRAIQRQDWEDEGELFKNTWKIHCGYWG